MAKYTPMIQQYLDIKAQAEDAFLFFRLGDFYELFFEDAINAARELEITLTARAGGTDEKIPMCGVPHHSATQYITRLIEKGYKVAICEQVEDPSEAKGIVRREIVRVITPGTVMDDHLKNGDSNNFIVSLTRLESAYALAACDLSTGELYETEIHESLKRLLDEALVYAPAEIVVDVALLDLVRSQWPSSAHDVVLTPFDQVDLTFLNDHFERSHVDRLSPLRKKSVALLMTYLRETQKRTLGHISTIKSYDSEQYMTLDPFTRRNLELVETVREREKKGSLLWLLDKTVTSMGARLLRRWIDKPLMSKTRIEARLEAVETLYNSLIVREEMRQQLKGIYDLERLVGKIAFGNANARDLLALKKSLQQVPLLFDRCLESESSTMRLLVEGNDLCDDVSAWIEAAIVEEPPLSIREGGMIKEDYDEHLDKLRDASVNGKQWMAELEQREREVTGIKSLKVSYNRNFGYFIEVTRANIGALPEGRYERKQTLTNSERYVTPELKEMETLILEAEEKMVEIEYSLFLNLRERIAQELTRLQALAEIIAEIDVYQSLATISATNHYRKPVITESYDFHVEAGRHPVVEAVLNDAEYIANDTHFERDTQRTLLITGPNMAGKSTYMRQVAFLCIMAQIGCFVPAQAATIPIVDRIFTRIGAADDLIGGQSTFMVEMMDIQLMTEKATERSLVIIDELGRGTSTGEGMAIAQAVIEYLHDEIGCKTLVSTHFHELAHLEDSLQHLKNYCMAVKESEDKVTFLRKLIEGAAGTSYGIYCARIAGLPDSIIKRSYMLLNHFDSRQTDAKAGAKADAKERQEAVQLHLFEPEPLDPKSEQVLEQIRNVDVMNMTPMDAMNFIYELKQQL